MIAVLDGLGRFLLATSSLSTSLGVCGRGLGSPLVMLFVKSAASVIRRWSRCLSAFVAPREACARWWLNGGCLYSTGSASVTHNG